MKVRFLKEWRGSQPGDIEQYPDAFCQNDLIPRGIVEEIKDDRMEKLAEENVKLKKKLAELEKRFSQDAEEKPKKPGRKSRSSTKQVKKAAVNKQQTAAEDKS
jgi:hypothetical protein